MKMADELDRVRISAAELRAEASNLANSGACQGAEEEELNSGQRQQRSHDNKRPALQRYQAGAGHGHHPPDSEEMDAPPACHGDPISSTFDPDEPARSPQEERQALSEPVPERHGCVDGGMGKDGGEGGGGGRGSSCGEARSSERQSSGEDGTCRKASVGRPQPTKEGGREKEKSWNDRHHPEPVGAASTSPKPARKTRKPDREIYQPGSRRSTQGKEHGAGKEQDRPPPSKEATRREPVTQREPGETEGKKDPAPRREGGEREGRRDSAKDGGNGREGKAREEKKKSGRGSDSNRRTEGREAAKVPDVCADVAVGDVTSRVEKLSVKEEEGKKGESEEGGDRRRKASGEGMRSRAGGGGGGGRREKEGADKLEDKRRERGNRRKRGEKEGNLDSRRGRAEGGGGGGKSERGVLEKGRDGKGSEEGGRKREGGGSFREALPAKSQEKPRDRGGKRENQAREEEPRVDRNKNRERAVEGSEQDKANANESTPSSKRYSKSDIRRPRNRKYSTSSASSGTSLDGLGQGGGEGYGRRERLGLGRRDRGEAGADSRGRGGGGAGGGQLQSKRRTPAEISSTDSMDESETGDRANDNRRKRRDGEEDWSPERRKENENRGRGGRGGGGRGGLLRMSLDKQSGTSQVTSAHVEDPLRRRQGLAPRGRGRGILILPAHTNLSHSPEPGPRLLFGGIRGGAGPGRGRGGRGGGTRRLWDPNNPDQKPALARSQHPQHPGLQQAMYLQTGGGYGPLHFLDTDDEAAGSPPVRQGEHFQSQQAAAMAFYKFQNSDNPYCYPMPAGNANNANVPSNPRYPYPYPISPYQTPPTNGMYPSPGMGQFYGGYRGPGYPQAGPGGGLTPEEAEQQARGELGKLLRAADSQELQLSNLLSRDRLSPDGLDRMAQLRADLLTLYERVILTDIEFSDSQNLDQALWKNVFYQVIEHFRQLLKEPGADAGPHIRTMLLTLLDEGALFFDALLQKLQTVFQFQLEDYMDGMAIRARPLRKTVKYALISAQRCMICQGDIARYREQASDSANYGKARSWYLKAQQIAPKNGRPYNQLALLAVYTKRKLDAVYYYMRSLAVSNPILTAKESLMSLFEEAKRKADQLERRRRQESEGGSRGPAVRGGSGRGEEGARVEIWVRPSGPAGGRRRGGGSESSRDSEQDGELGCLSTSDLNKRFILSFLYAHGKLFTKVGMESFPDVAGRVLQEFRALLQHSPSPLGSTRTLQIITINMFTIHNAQSRDRDGDVRSVLQEQTIALGLAMFGLLVQRCTDLLRETPAEPIMAEDGDEGEELEGMVRVSAFPLDLRDLLPSIKVWSDWMLGHPDLWNPPPCSIDGSPDVWQCLAQLCNALARVDHGEAPLYKADGDGGEGDEDLRLLLLEEDRLLAGFVPLLAAPQEPCYIDRHADTAIAADCKRVTVLKYFLEALCGQEEPLLAFKGGKYVSMATSPLPPRAADARSRQDSQTERESDDVIVEESSSLSASEGERDGEDGGASEDDIRELRARRHALTSKLAQQQRRRDKIQEALQPCSQLELEVCPVFLVPDTNAFIDHLAGLRALLLSSTYILVVPLIVITELDGLAKGQESGGPGPAGRGGAGGHRGNPGPSVAHARAVQDKARLAVAFLERGFEAREPRLRALTSRGSQLDSIAFRSEDTSGQQGNNDDVILSCCLHYCKDKAKDFMPAQRNGPVRLRREVVLLTDDRNLRVKALTRNVPVRDIPAFLSWAKVG